MFKKYLSIFFAVALGLTLAAVLFTAQPALAAARSQSLPASGPALAVLPQVVTPTLVTQPVTQTVTITTTLPAVDPAYVLSFSDLGLGELVLNGPYDGNSVVFSVPASWKLTPGAALDLLFSTSIYSASGLQSLGGTLTVEFNNVTIATLQIRENGEHYEHILIPDRALTATRIDGRHELRLSLDSGETCDIDEQFTMIIQPESRFVLPHEFSSPTTDLSLFPRPFSKDATWPDSVVIVLPDQPNSAELQSALTIGAGLGNLTGSAFTMTMTTESLLTDAQRAASHVIMVGKAASFGSLGTLKLSAPVAAQGFEIAGSLPEDGVIQSVLSPWNDAKIVLLVSGATDGGVLKASQALSTGLIRPTGQPNVAAVASVEPQAVPYAIPVDQTLADLGYTLKDVRDRLNRPGISSSIFLFYAPPGQIPSAEAYFELTFNHSALLNFSRSGLVVLVNDQPIGSFSFNESSAAQTNTLRFNIPTPVLLPGQNRIEIRSSLIPADICTSPELSGLWITYSLDSNLHLPLAPVTIGSASFFDLSLYPAPFVLHPTMDSTAFVVARDDVQSWNTALTLAADLGDRLNGQIITLSAYFADDLPETGKSEKHLILVGRPSLLPILAELNDKLPGPFDPGADTISDTKDQVVYRFGPDTPVGYLELLRSPWNNERVVFIVSGNSDAGVELSLNALLVPSLRSKLGGDLSTITTNQITATDTRLGIAEVTDITTGQEQQPIEPQPELTLTPFEAARPTWILPVLLVAIGLMLLTLLVVAIRGMRRS